MGIQKNIKGLIFDFDGTIFDLAVDWQDLKNRLKRVHNVTLSQINNLQKEKYSQVLSMIEDAEIQGVNTGEPKPDAKTTLEVLAKKYKILIVSRNNRKTVEAGLSKIGITDFPPIIARGDTKSTKPHIEPLELAAQKLKLNLNELAVVGDTFHDIEMARAAGAYAIATDNPQVRFRPVGADRYIKNLSELIVILEPKTGE